MQVFDCFPFFNEIDLLELRLNELWEVVDVFVVVEARESFTGNRKPLCVKENEKRLKKYMQKVRYIELEEFPEGVMGWAREHYQRNFLRTALTDVSPSDIIILSDVDEIPKASTIEGIVKRGIKKGEVFCLSLDNFVFYLNVRLPEKWDRQGPRLIRADDLRTFQDLRRVFSPTTPWPRDFLRQLKASLRMGQWIKRILIEEGGWHFTWMGGAQAVALKGGAINVHKSLPAGNKNLDWATNRMSALLDKENGFELIDIDELPEFVGKNPDQFAPYFLGSG